MVKRRRVKVSLQFPLRGESARPLGAFGHDGGSLLALSLVRRIRGVRKIARQVGIRSASSEIGPTSHGLAGPRQEIGPVAFPRSRGSKSPDVVPSNLREVSAQGLDVQRMANPP